MILDSSAFVARPHLLTALWHHAISLDCAEDRVLFRQGDNPSGLFFLHAGDASMTMQSDRGVEVVTAVMEPGSLLGLPAIVIDKPYSMTAVAKTGATVGFVNRNDFSAMMLSEPALAMMILQVLAAEVRSTRLAFANGEPSPHRGRSLRRKPLTPA
jgi:CRP-like cAMP-binding protein